MLFTNLHVEAALHDRGVGLIYDDVLNVTWSQDANPAGTLGLGGVWPPFTGAVKGYMNYNDAKDFINTLNQSRYLGFDDWRLPNTSPLNGIEFVFGDILFGCEGVICDIGYNIGAPGTPYQGSTASELAYMFHTNLSNQSMELPDGSVNTTTCSHDEPYCLSNAGPFVNLIPGKYWSGQFAPVPVSTGPSGDYFVYLFSYGSQSYEQPNSVGLVWPVRDGDVGATRLVAHAVPIHPSVIGIMSIGCVLLAAYARTLSKSKRRFQ